MVSINDLFRYTVVIFFFLDIIMVSFMIYPPDCYNPSLTVSENGICIWDNHTNDFNLKKEFNLKSTREYDAVTIQFDFYNNNSECFKSVNITNGTTNHKLSINTIVKLPEKPHHINYKIVEVN